MKNYQAFKEKNWILFYLYGKEERDRDMRFIAAHEAKDTLNMEALKQSDFFDSIKEFEEWQRSKLSELFKRVSKMKFILKYIFLFSVTICFFVLFFRFNSRKSNDVLPDIYHFYSLYPMDLVPNSSIVINNYFIDEISSKFTESIIVNNEEAFKRYLQLLIHLGRNIIKSDNFINCDLFYYHVVKLTIVCTQNKLFSKYDWYHFAVAYPFIVIQLLLILKKMNKNQPNSILFKNQFYDYDYFEKSIQTIITGPCSVLNRTYDGQNAMMIGISWLTLALLRAKENEYSDILSNFKLQRINCVTNDDGLYNDGTFIYHGGLRTYNYLLLTLEASLFFNTMYKDIEQIYDLNKIFNFLPKLLHATHRRVNPAICTRFGKFLEIYNKIAPFVELNPSYRNWMLNDTGIFLFKHGNFISAMFKYWSTQLVGNSKNLAIGEYDIFNTSILKQMWLSKIINHTTSHIAFDNSSLYPGVLFTMETIQNAKSFSIKKNTSTVHLSECNGVTNLISMTTGFSYSDYKINHQHLIMSLKEFNIVNRNGIFTFYWDYEGSDNLLCLERTVEPLSSKFTESLINVSAKLLHTDASEQKLMEINIKKDTAVYVAFNTKLAFVQTVNEINTSLTIINQTMDYIKFIFIMEETYNVEIVKNKFVKINNATFNVG